jgi:hypothetical protein
MQEEEILKRGIDILLDSIRDDWENLQKPSLSGADRNRIRHHINYCIDELKKLTMRLIEP